MKKIKLLNILTTLIPTLSIIKAPLDPYHVARIELHFMKSNDTHEQGHAYIRVFNSSEKLNKFGYYTASKGEVFTLGLWNKKSTYANDLNVEGVFYNREEFLYSQIDTSSHKDFFISTDINRDEISAFSNHIRLKNNDYNVFSSNCGHFAYDLFNLVADSDQKLDKSFLWPGQLQDYIQDRWATSKENYNDYNADHFFYYEDGLKKIYDHIGDK